ncbi:DUF7507 domain-containing protein, partial [Methanocrinis sp.]|uniref:DUF7507 domain-containing protein n=1 Tax=Methanocrinis sp. TaxID=3101522 RepID=UPI003D0DF156
MRLENLLVVGIALFFVMVVANGEDSVSGESSNIAVILVIDNSKSVNDLDQDGKRFDKAMSFIGLLNNSAHVVGLVSTSGDVIKRGDLDYKRVDPTDNFSKINETIISIRDANKPAKETNIRKLFKLATEQLKDIKYNNKIIIFFSDGVNNCDESENPENIENFWVYTVGLGNDSMGIEFLKNISNSTYSEFNRIDSFYPEILLSGILGRINAEIASIDVNKTAELSSGSNGSLVNFTINVTNTGNAILNSVILTDTLSEGLDYVSSTGSFDNSSNNVTWDLGLLNKSEPRVVYLIASINSSTFGNLTNFVDVEGKPNPRYAVADNDSVNVTVIDASISVNKTSNVTSGSNGTLVNFTIKVTNTRNATLNPVILTDALPEGLDYVSSTGSFDNSSNNVTWNLGTLDKSEPRVVYLEARINRSEPGILTNLVSVEGKPEFGYNVTDNSSAPVKVVNASISVNKTAYPESGSNGTRVNFTINVTNTGQVNFTQIEVVDVLPYGLDKISYNRSGSVDGQNVTWILSGLNVSESKFIELVAQINGSKFGNLTNNIIVVGVPPTGDQVKNNDSENVTALRPGIEVNKTADPEEGVPSTNVTFLINV